MPRRTREGGFPMIPRSMMAVRVLVTVSLLAVAALARALPIQLTDTNSTRYNVNTQVAPLITASDASGALTNATYTKADTVTNYYVVFTLFGGSSTQVIATSTGDTSLGAQDLWFTTAQSVPQGTTSFQPRIGYVVQNTGGATPASAVGINSLGQAAFTFTPTIPAGGTVIVMTFVTVQGKSSQTKSTCEDIVANPLPSDAIKCMSEQELAEVVNFPKITPPTLKNATVKLKFNKTGQDTVQWKGKVTVGAGISLQGLPITVDFGGVTQSFLLSKSGSANDGGGNKFDLQAQLSNGLTKAANGKFSFNLKGD